RNVTGVQTCALPICLDTVFVRKRGREEEHTHQKYNWPQLQVDLSRALLNRQRGVAYLYTYLEFPLHDDQQFPRLSLSRHIYSSVPISVRQLALPINEYTD